MKYQIVACLLLIVCIHTILSLSIKNSLANSNKVITKINKNKIISLYSSNQSINPCPFAPNCKGLDRSNGCDGSGKIQGGIATISLFSWWPIKVYRPCPSYIAAGYVYKREGQTMDQVLFSEPSNKMKEKIELERLLNEKKKLDEAINSDLNNELYDNLNEEEKFLSDKFNKKE